jgi:hypothetical protein
MRNCLCCVLSHHVSLTPGVWNRTCATSGHLPIPTASFSGQPSHASASPVRLIKRDMHKERLKSPFAHLLLADTDAATARPELISAASASLLWDEGAFFNAMKRICVYNPVMHGEGASSFSPFMFLKCSTAKMTSGSA